MAFRLLIYASGFFMGDKVCLWWSARGWPATGGAWAVVGGWAQGGAKGWFRSMQSPADGLASPGHWPPWGLRRLYALRGMGF